MDYNQAKSFLTRTLSKTKYEANKRRNLDFDIDIEYVMSVLIKQDGKCALTGRNLEFVRGGSWHGKNPNGATMDRIDNSKGYVRGNIQITCGLVNTIKSDLNNELFLELCRAVTESAKFN